MHDWKRQLCVDYDADVFVAEGAALARTGRLYERWGRTPHADDQNGFAHSKHYARACMRLNPALTSEPWEFVGIAWKHIPPTQWATGPGRRTFEAFRAYWNAAVPRPFNIESERNPSPWSVFQCHLLGLPAWQFPRKAWPLLHGSRSASVRCASPDRLRYVLKINRCLRTRWGWGSAPLILLRNLTRLPQGFLAFMLTLLHELNLPPFNVNVDAEGRYIRLSLDTDAIRLAERAWNTWREHSPRIPMELVRAMSWPAERTEQGLRAALDEDREWLDFAVGAYGITSVVYQLTGRNDAAAE